MPPVWLSQTSFPVCGMRCLSYIDALIGLDGPGELLQPPETPLALLHRGGDTLGTWKGVDTAQI